MFMNTLKSLFVSLVVLVLISSCRGDENPYDPQAQLEIDVEAIQNYLIENNIQAEIDVSGVHYRITRPTSGAIPEIGDIVDVEYELYNFNGDLLDTSIEQVARDGGIFQPGRPYQPFEVALGTNGVIPGFERAILLLQEGAKGTFYIPSVLAYQNTGAGRIQPNENLIFIIELVRVD